jgi:hypothetical protein
MLVQLFVVEERLTTGAAGVALGTSDPLFTGRGPSPSLCPCLASTPATRVVAGCRAPDQHMTLDLEPPELEEVGPGVLVPKHPLVLSLWVQAAPVASLPPLPRFARVRMRGVADLRWSIQLSSDWNVRDATPTR